MGRINNVSLQNNWRYKRLTHLDNVNYGDPANAPTPLVRRCLELCKVPINEFSIENLRLMIGQEFSLKYLVPLAIEKLSEDIFAEGDYYKGDLLNNVFKIKAGFWTEFPSLWNQVNELTTGKEEEIEELGLDLLLFKNNRPE